MKRTPTILAGIFLAITLTRVAVLVQNGFHAGVLGWLYSGGLGFGVYLASYYMRVSAMRKGEETRASAKTRAVATTCLIFFVFVDGVFNLVEVLRSMTDPTLVFAAWIYGLFPTIAVGLLGVLQGYVDRIPTGVKRPDLFGIIGKRLANKLQVTEIIEPEPLIEDVVKKLTYDDYRQHPRASRMRPDKIVSEFGVSLSTAYDWKRRLKSERNESPF